MPTLLVAVSLMSPLAALAAGPFTALHPEQAYPDPNDQASQEPFSGLIRRVQETLRELGFDAGPPNGDFSPKTQAALAQFQLSRTIPASGQLDDQTLAELGVKRDEAQASTGSSTPPEPSPPSDAATAAATSGERQPEGETGEK